MAAMPPLVVTVSLAWTLCMCFVTRAVAADASPLAATSQSSVAGSSSQLCSDGDQALQSGDTDTAFKDYVAAYQAVQQEAGTSQEARLSVERRYVLALSCGGSTTNADKLESALGLAILHEANASPGRQLFAISLLRTRIISSKALYTPTEAQYLRKTEPSMLPLSDITYCEHILRSIIDNTRSSPEDLPLLKAASELLPDVELSLIGVQLQKGEMAEAAAQWSSALTLYEGADAAAKSLVTTGISRTFNADDAKILNRQAIAAVHSVALLRQASVAPTAQSGEFLGVDHTVGPDWQNSVGHEAWVMFGAHGDDLGGGSALLSREFSYLTIIPDVDNQVRRFRDEHVLPASLSDPTAQGEKFMSFLDDNGEAYPGDTGPDLYIQLTIPAGAHILTVPVYFSSPVPTQGHHSIFLFAGNVNGETDFSRCLASGTVSGDDEGGYARIAITGPARDTLVIRRLECLNTNVQALFLDPDLRSQPPPSLAEAFAADELQKAMTDNTLRDVARQYAALSQGPTPQDWSALSNQASGLMSDASLSAGDRAVAAYVAWHSLERCPLRNVDMGAAFQSYLMLEFGAAGSRLTDSTELATLAQHLRDRGYNSFAEQADDRLWDMLVANRASTFALDHVQLIRDLWAGVSQPCLQSQTDWLWQGEGQAPPNPMVQVVDYDYVAQKTAMLVQAVLSNNYTSGLMTTGSNQPAAANEQSIAYDDPSAERARELLDTIGQEIGISINGVDSSTPGHPAPVSQSVAAHVYAAAAEPLVGTELSGTARSPMHSQPCLLRPDQIETLARAVVDRSENPGAQWSLDQEQSLKLLRFIQAHYARTYPRMASVNSMATWLASTQ